eukprot:TRINITY_DN11790_c0_g1_i1.p1 TRINITY_DN11790_c0_g1~~TRINITY_DN11790_c0_g1_i1.p1  ORF type:complete len:219 (-),score=35.71 TRINITY_DN11790_c0_g1_i1:115-771(-)
MEPLNAFHQPFEYIVVLDFEAAWDERGPSVAEIIEFPSVLIRTSDNAIVSETQMFLKLKDLPKLHPETTKITGITQAQVDSGLAFPDALKAYHSWLETNGVVPSTTKLAFATCGDWDLGKMLPLQCAKHNVERPSYFGKWINIKNVFDKFYNRKKPVSGMAAMLNILEMQLVGHHHSGIDDCRNLARIVTKMIAAGCQFETTASDENNPMKQKKRKTN